MQSGQEILNYTIIDQIEPSLFLAQHKKIDRKVWVKVLDKELYKDDDTRERFRKEANTLSQLKHPNIQGVFDYIEDNDEAYLITEYVEGLTLDQFINQQKLADKKNNDKLIKPIFLQILDGVGHAHHLEVIHHDLKPSDIIVSPSGQVKILNFGLSKVINAKPDPHTLQYQSPEVLKNGVIDKRSDIYSLGIILFKMLTGRLPYEDQKDIQSVRTLIEEETIPSPKTVKKSVNDKMTKILARATDRMSFQRYQTCEDFKKDILAGTAIDPDISQSSKKGFSFLTFFWIFLAFMVGATTYFIISNMMEDQKQQKLSTTVDTTLVREDVIVKPKPIEEEKEEEPKEEVRELTPEEIKADSIRRAEAAKRDRIKKYHKARMDKATRNLLIDGQFASHDLGQYVINIEVFNKNQDVAFKDVFVEVKYYNSKNDVIAKSNQVIPYVGKKEGAAIEVSKEVNAKRFTCELNKLTLVEDENPVILDEDGYPVKAGANSNDAIPPPPSEVDPVASPEEDVVPAPMPVEENP